MRSFLDRSFFEADIPKDAIILGDRSGAYAAVWQKGEKWMVKAFRSSKVKKPDIYHYYSKRDNALAEGADFIKRIGAHKERVSERRKARTSAGNALKVGDILYSSWGYDQTNVDWYQVVKVSGKSVWVIGIRGNYEETGFMSGYTKPVKYKGPVTEEILKKATRHIVTGSKGNTIKVGRHYAWLWDGAKRYESHYA